MSHTKYVKNLIKRFNLDGKSLDGKQITKTFMSTTLRLTKDNIGIHVEHLYPSMIGSLLYLIVSRLDIYFSIGVCARFQSNPRVSHLNIVNVSLNTSVVVIMAYSTLLTPKQAL